MIKPVAMVAGKSSMRGKEEGTRFKREAWYVEWDVQGAHTSVTIWCPRAFGPTVQI